MFHESVIVFLLAVVALSSAPPPPPPPPSPPSTPPAAGEWWRDTFIYQIYPRSFKDSDGDGVGDLRGIQSKIDYLANLNISAFWLSPIFKSPMVDFGYDISNFTAIDPIFGNIDDFRNLTAAAHSRGLKVILDWVPNHSSDEHPWFNKSINKIKPYDEYYVWENPRIINGTRHPPNNWLSIFYGSAWEWNEKRQQYYLHQFAVKQPDLNFRNADLRKEMEDALIYWINNGADGFRIDSIPYIYEDSKLRDEPVLANTGRQPDDPATLDHIYTIDQIETYEIVQAWRYALDSLGGEKKIVLTEAYTSLPNTVKFYEYGSNVPFNFMMVTGLNNHSTALDFKRSIDAWINNIPKGGDYIANWVVDNHDNPRVTKRFGTLRADQNSMLAAILPGLGVIYNGDEIGMENLFLTWNQTVDPQGCNAGPDRYAAVSRDGERTPFQWDSSTSAGFSTRNQTWLPVNPNYKTLNLAAQKNVPKSHYGIFKKLVELKSNPIVKTGTLEVIVVTENILGVVRRLPSRKPIVLLINFSNNSVKVDASAWMNIPPSMNVYTSSVSSNLSLGERVDTTSLNLLGASAVILA